MRTSFIHNLRNQYLVLIFAIIARRPEYEYLDQFKGRSDAIMNTNRNSNGERKRQNSYHFSKSEGSEKTEKVAMPKKLEAESTEEYLGDGLSVRGD